jgi:UDP-N-acetyl-D-mannosaminuronic acid transferase (WecB/TagA/CpsF family)
MQKHVPPNVYVAPKYGRPVADEALLALVRQSRPAHLVIAVGGGIQDQLGLYLLERLDYRPAVHCIGAALGFLTGDQVRIPDWADRYYVGWFFRSLAQPRVFIPRFWSARRLPVLIWRYRDRLPPLQKLKN